MRNLFFIVLMLSVQCAHALSTFYVNTASASGGDGTTSATSGSTRAFSSLREAITSSGLHISQPRLILCSGTLVDTFSVTQTHWNTIDTTAVNYLTIRGDNTTGKWNTSAFRISVTNTHGIYNNNPGHVRIENLQVQITSTTSGSSGYVCLRLSTQNVGTGHTDCDCRFSSCIAKGVPVGSEKISGFYNSPFAETNGGLIRLFNCVAFNCAIGFGTAWDQVINYNNSGYGNSESDFEDVQVVLNCLGGSASPSAGNFTSVGTGGGLSDYNASVDTSAVGTHKRISQTFTFTDASNGDLHLTSSDAGAKDFGVSDPASGLFSDDIDAQTRSGSWDIGADEYQSASGTRTTLSGNATLSGKVN